MLFDQLFYSTFFFLIGQTLSANAARRLLTTSQQVPTVQEQINQLLEQNRHLQKQID